MARVWVRTGMVALCAVLAACQQQGDAGTRTETPWPSSLRIVGDGFPKAGDPCRVVGESAATIDLLDDSATLVGCRDAADAARLGGRSLGEVDGVHLTSVPRAAAGDGDGQGDAKVPGTDYNAFAEIRCAGYDGAKPGTCRAGVKRNGADGTWIDVSWPGDRTRTIFFDAKGDFLTFGTAEADGSAALTPTAKRRGDTWILTLGPEYYEIPDVLVRGD